MLKINSIVFIILLLILSSCGAEKEYSADSIAVSLLPDTTSQNFDSLGEYNNYKKNEQVFIDFRQFNHKHENVKYVVHGRSQQVLDIIYPEMGQPPYKFIIAIHGGGWMSGDKQSASLNNIFTLLHHGYAIVSVNYRLSTTDKWPAQLLDIKAAVRFLKANAQKYQLDTQTILVSGNSAGGHLAEMMGATNGQDNFDDYSLGNKKFSSKINGVISFYGASDLRDLSPLGMPAADSLMGFDIAKNGDAAIGACPLELINEHYPPILLIHGTKDNVVSYLQSVKMQAAVNLAVGKNIAELITVHGAYHGDPKLKSDEVLEQVFDFTDKIYFNNQVNPYRSKNFKEFSIIDTEGGK